MKALNGVAEKCGLAVSKNDVAGEAGKWKTAGDVRRTYLKHVK